MIFYFCFLLLKINVFLGMNHKEQFSELSSDIYSIELENKTIKSSKESDLYLIDIQSITSEYPSDKFHFDITLYKKILMCRLYNKDEFSVNDLETLLYFGLPSLEPNNNMYNSFLKSLVKGKYYQIISDFLISIRTTLIRTTIQEIIEYFSKDFISDFYRDKQKINEFLYENNLKTIHEFNALIYDGDLIKIKMFFQTIYDYFFEKIKLENESHFDFYKELNENCYFFYQKIYEKIEIFTLLQYNHHLRILKEYDKFIWMEAGSKMKEIKLNDSYLILSFLDSNIPKEKDNKGFWIENSKIFFAFDFLNLVFLDHFLTKVDIIVINKNGDYIKFFPQSDQKINEIIRFYFEDIAWFDIFYLYDLKYLSNLNNFMQTPESFLDFIVSLKIEEITINNFLLEEYNSTNHIDIKSINYFLLFYNKFPPNEYKIEFRDSIKIYFSEIKVKHKKNGFQNSIIQLFIRHILRESYNNILLKNLQQDKIDCIQNLYNLLEIEKNDDFIKTIFFFQNKLPNLTTKNIKIIEKILNSIEKINENENYLLENNDYSIVFNSENLIYDRLHKIIISGKSYNININCDWIVYGTIYGNFHHIILLNSQLNYSLPTSNNFQFNKTEVIPSAKVCISSNQNLCINIHNILIVKNISDNILFQNHEIKFNLNFLFGSKLQVKFFYIHSEIIKICFLHSNLSKIDLFTDSIHFGESSNKEKKNYKFINCYFYLKTEFESNIEKLYCKNCTFRKNIIISDAYQIDNIVIELCRGSIFWGALELAVRNEKLYRIFMYTKNKDCLIENYVLYNIIDLDLKLYTLKLSNNEIYSSIIIRFDHLNIKSCIGNFCLYLSQYTNKISQIELTYESTIEINLSQKVKILKFHKLTFYDEIKLFQAKNPKFKFIFENCYEKNKSYHLE